MNKLKFDSVTGVNTLTMLSTVTNTHKHMIWLTVHYQATKLEEYRKNALLCYITCHRLCQCHHHCRHHHHHNHHHHWLL